jgi:putative hydrolase of the HAD superfamily
MIKLFVFDLGKVILPFDHLPVVPKFLSTSRLGDRLDPREVFSYMFDWTHGTYVSYEEGRISTEKFFGDIQQRYELQMSLDEFKALWCGIFWEDTEVSSVVRGLKKAGYPLFLLSNTNEMHFDHIARNYPIVQEFDRLILSHKVRSRKPNRAIYEEIFKHSEALPSEILFIDDMKANVEGARELGIQAHLFTDAKGLREELDRHGVKI